jgi:hypothetical protein
MSQRRNPLTNNIKKALSVRYWRAVKQTMANASSSSCGFFGSALLLGRNRIFVKGVSLSKGKPQEVTFKDPHVTAQAKADARRFSRLRLEPDSFLWIHFYDNKTIR